MTETMIEGEGGGPHVLVIRLQGALSHANVDGLERALERVLGEGEPRIALDFSGVVDFNSAFLASMLDVRRRAQDAGGGLCIFSARRRVTELLAELGLGDIFRSYASQQEAVAALAE